MCRNIKKLRHPDRPPTDEEIHEAALQFIRKVSGYRVPSKANELAFQKGVAEVAAATRNLFDSLLQRQPEGGGRRTRRRRGVSASQF
jgi:hypothetical protein